MEENKQKTVVAFIAGLLIGGLLVWVFSIAPNKKNDMGPDQTNDQNSEVQTDGEGNKPDATDTTKSSSTDKNATKQPEASVVAQGAGSLVVEDQPAGMRVTLGAVTMPVKNGWIVVHEMNGGAMGNILGASRYSDAEGLKPNSIDLLRATVAGKMYKVLIYSENGDRVFDKKEDVLVKTEGGDLISDTFTAK